MVKKLPDEFQEILVLASRTAYAMGFKLYIIGGVVRDFILKREVKDLDLVVEGDAIALAARVAQSLGVEYKKHHAFGTASVIYNGHNIDFATSRRETYSKDGALPKVTPSDLKSDLARRDFTINAMAISLNTLDYGRLMDNFNGVDDLRDGLLRILHDQSFRDDPTRILRGIRFEQRFGFKFEKHTSLLMDQANKDSAVRLVHPHRLHDEIVLLLKEPSPIRCIRRVDELCGISVLFGIKALTLDKNDWELLLRLDSLVAQAAYKFNRFREVDAWLVFLIAIIAKLPKAVILKFMDDYGFKKGERMRAISIKDNIVKVGKLNKDSKPHTIYRVLNPLSFEAILFFYAYFYEDKKITENIEYFMTHLVNTRLKITGEDLKSAGIKPENIYTKLMDAILDHKLSAGLSTKQAEIDYALSVYTKFKKNS